MKSTKISLYVIISLLTFGIFSNNVNAAEYTNYFGIEINETQYNNLLNQGFTQDEIYYMNEETFNENKDLNATLEAINSKFYKSIYTDLYGNLQTIEITESEYENAFSNQARGSVETTYKRMESFISKIDNTYFRYKVGVAWKNMPSVRSYDIIGLSHSNSDKLDIAGLIKFQYTYCISNGTCYTEGNYYNKTEYYNGGSAVYKFASNAISMTTILYYDVRKNTSDTITYQAIYGDYAHATSNVNASIYNNHTMTNGGLALGTSSQYYDAIPCAETGWNGTW